MFKFIERIKDEMKYLSRSDWSVSDVASFWDSVVDYDEQNEHVHAHNRRFSDSYKYIDLTKESKVFDFCTRTGDAVDFYLGHTDLKDVVCADVSKLFLEKCKDRFADRLPDLEINHITDYRLPFDDEIFDVALCYETIEHFSDYQKYIAEINRILKPGSQAVFTTPNVLWEAVHSLAAVLNLHHSEGPHKFIQRKNIIRAIEDSGFVIQKEITSVLLPFGNKKLLAFFEKLEKRIPVLMRFVGLRRIFICKK